ncbi:MAG: hypothetical protein K6U79_07755 [Firmicutes bacterium]|nr:hypothetical protein [Bacillota bacterium]
MDAGTEPGREEGLLRGTFDFHVHAAPSLFPRALGDLQLAREARAAGMAGFVLKAHEGSTAERAALVEEAVPGLRVAGSVTLNHFVGGFNPAAVEAALALGARVVWFPTVHAAWHLRHYGGAGYREQPSLVELRPRPPLSPLDGKGRLLPEVEEILEQIAAAGAVLCTGHLSPEESRRLLRAARERGVERRVFTHPDLAVTRIGLEEQRELAREGNYLEKSFLTTLPPWGEEEAAAVAASIRELGAGSVLLQTDLGQRANGSPVAGWRRWLEALLAAGLKAKELERAAGGNALELLDA